LLGGDRAYHARVSLVELRGLAVRYGATRALAAVDLEVASGEIHALVGENGAGKSTLLRVLAGLAIPEAGGVRLFGVPGPPRDPVEAERRGVGYAPQEITLCPELSVADLVTLGREPRGWLGLVDRARQAREAAGLLRRLGAEVDVRCGLAGLGAPMRKRIQIARALAAAPRLLLLDEPTAALDAPGAAAVSGLLREHAAAGGAAILVSHRIAEVLAVADVVSVLRDGRRVLTRPARELDPDALIRAMVGRELPPATGAATAVAGEEVLAVAGPVALRLRRGEVVGLAGLVGAGRSRALEAIARAHPRRVALVPEERSRKGLVPTLTLRENLFLPARGILLRPARERSEAAGWIERLGIRARGPDVPIGELSGGNQQKVLFARALARQRPVVLLDEPTQGVDVAAKAEIHRLVRDLAAGGTAVVLASSDLPELLRLTDRIVVLCAGRAVAELETHRTSEAEVMAFAVPAGRP
jgi:ABC-type sugar transport system ATPase subunit